MKSSPYIECRDGAYRVVGSRVSLDSIAHAFLNGQTAESIARSFPVLTLEQVYGAITFYLANRSELDAYLEKGRAEFGRQRRTAREAEPELSCF